MDISFVIATLGRSKEVGEVLQSILEFTPAEYAYEVHIVDQNADDRLETTIKSFANAMNLIHHKVGFRGASKARNYGVKHAKGYYINFPDDDSRILEGAVKKSINFLKNNNYILISGKSINTKGEDSMTRFPEKPQEITIQKIEKIVVEYTFFTTRAIMEKYPFDEILGVGCFHGSDECFDVIYRMLEQKERLYFDPSITYYHPQPVIDHALPRIIQRSFSYRCGYAKASIKHGLYLRIVKRLMLVLAYLPYCMIFSRHKVRFYLAEILGIFAGIIVKEQRV